MSWSDGRRLAITYKGDARTEMVGSAPSGFLRETSGSSSAFWVWNCSRKVALVQLQGWDHTGDRRVACVELLWNSLEYRDFRAGLQLSHLSEHGSDPQLGLLFFSPNTGNTLEHHGAKPQLQSPAPSDPSRAGSLPQKGPRGPSYQPLPETLTTPRRTETFTDRATKEDSLREGLIWSLAELQTRHLAGGSGWIRCGI